MTAKTLAELPENYDYRVCEKEKPVDEMVLVRVRSRNLFLLRRICKECPNRQERDHRRPWKRAYLRRWRARNRELNESYWRQRTEDERPLLTKQRLDYREKNRDALLIQGRLRRRLGLKTTMADAKRLCPMYGPCYPTKFGLTPAEVERLKGPEDVLVFRGRASAVFRLRHEMEVQGIEVSIDPLFPYDATLRPKGNSRLRRKNWTA